MTDTPRFTFIGSSIGNAPTSPANPALAKQTPMATFPVNATTGAWSWTRSNMGTST